MKNWADIVSDLEARGWSLTGLGRAIGLSPQAVSDIKQGRTKAPSGMAAVKLHDLHSRGEGPDFQPARELAQRIEQATGEIGPECVPKSTLRPDIWPDTAETTQEVA